MQRTSFELPDCPGNRNGLTENGNDLKLGYEVQLVTTGF